MGYPFHENVSHSRRLEGDVTKGRFFRVWFHHFHIQDLSKLLADVPKAVLINSLLYVQEVYLGQAYGY